MIAKSRSEGKKLGVEFYFTATRCKNGHFANRRTNCGHCVECQAQQMRSPQWRAYRRKNFEKNRELVLAQSKAYYAANKDVVIQRTTAWAKKNRPKCNNYGSRWAKRNPEKQRAKVVARRVQKPRAMPAWVDRSEIVNVYRECRRRCRETGIKYHVDHIVPLRGKTVSGLHVPWNLQIITAEENFRKQATFRPDP